MLKKLVLQAYSALRETLRNAPDENRTRDLRLERRKVAGISGGIPQLM
jgi:hypothetical protein